MPVFYLLLVPVGLYLLIQIWQTTTLYRYTDKPGPDAENWPAISIMVAARNEEAGIGACLNALCNLDYPKNKLLIVVGDDQSSDRTAEIVQSYVQQYPHIKLVTVVDDDSGLKAKARVMAQLDKHVNGDYYLVTDADVAVKPGWAKMLVRHMQGQVGVASGTTMVKGDTLFGQLQGIDWAYFMGLLNAISYSGVPATAVGNNMIIRSDAYWQTGGYGAIKFSITEDYKLYSEVCKLGWKWNNIMVPEVLAYSQPVKGFGTLLHQRKRWLSGGKELPWYWWILFGVFAMFYFLIPLLLWVYPLIGGIFWGVKWVLQMLQVNRIYQCVGEKPPGLLYHLGYELYLFAVTVSTALFFITPWKTIWKGRKY